LEIRVSSQEKTIHEKKQVLPPNLDNPTPSITTVGFPTQQEHQRSGPLNL
jgi:hypothetical protein